MDAARKFINYLLQFGSLTEDEIHFISAKIFVIELNKNDYFSKKNIVANQMGFVIDGILRTCYFNENEDMVTKYFICENEFAIDLQSYSTQTPSTECIVSVTNSKLVVLKRSDIQEISSKIIAWNEIIKTVTAQAMMLKVNRISPMITDDAKTKYLKFLENYPGVANRVPLSLIASYLGITLSSLSRIRKSI
jgi:hypothetical protein